MNTKFDKDENVMNEENKDIYLAFCKKLHNMLKTTCNASIRTTIHGSKMKVQISHLGIAWTFWVRDIQNYVTTDNVESVYALIIDNYKKYVNYKFFF